MAPGPGGAAREQQTVLLFPPAPHSLTADSAPSQREEHPARVTAHSGQTEGDREMDRGRDTETERDAGGVQEPPLHDSRREQFGAASLGKPRGFELAPTGGLAALPHRHPGPNPSLL